MKFLTDMLTEGKSPTFCPVRVCLFAAGVVYHLGVAWMVFGQHTALDWAALRSYLQDLLSLAGTTAVSVGVKSSLKADAPSQP